MGCWFLTISSAATTSIIIKKFRSFFFMIRLAEIIGSIADHAENAGDMMRTMLAKWS